MGLYDSFKTGLNKIWNYDPSGKEWLLENHIKDYDYTQYQLNNEIQYSLASVPVVQSINPAWTDAKSFAKRAEVLYFKCTVSRACIEKRAQGISEISLNIKGNAQVQDLLKNPNPTDKTLTNSLRNWETSLSIGGDLYWFWDFRNALAPRIWAFRQDLVANNTEQKQFEYVPNRMNGKSTKPAFVFKYDAFGETTQAFEFVNGNYVVIPGFLQRVSYYNPLYSSEGAGAGDSALRAVDNWLVIQELIHKKMKSGGAKFGYFTGASVRSEKDVADLTAVMSNLNRQKEINVLAGSMDFVANQLTFAEMQLLELRAVEAAAIQDAFKVPGVLLNSTTQTTYANMRAGDKIFYRSFIAPEAKWLIGQLEYGIRKYIDPEAEVTVDETDIAHIQDDQMQMAKDMAATGCFKIDEIRAVLGREPLPKGEGDHLATGVVHESVSVDGTGSGQPETKPKGPVSFNADSGNRADNNPQNKQ